MHALTIALSSEALEMQGHRLGCLTCKDRNQPLQRNIRGPKLMNNNRLLLVSTTFNIMNAVSIIYIFPLLGKAIILSEIPVNYYSLSFFFLQFSKFQSGRGHCISLRLINQNDRPPGGLDRAKIVRRDRTGVSSVISFPCNWTLSPLHGRHASRSHGSAMS
jgi:hypothetical protein